MDLDSSAWLALAWVGAFLLFSGSLVSAMTRSVLNRKHLRVVAQRFRGRVLAEGMGERPRLEFEVDGVKAEFEYAPGPWSRVRFLWAPPGQLRIAPQGVLGSVRALLDSADARIEDAEFARRFDVQGQPQAWAEGVLDAETRARILALADPGNTGRRDGLVRIEVGPPGVTVYYKGNLAADTDALANFLGHSVALLDRLRATLGDRTRLLRAAEVAAAGRCPVCGDALSGALRRCSRCGTLHHDDCWDYFGSCALYACSSRHGRKERG